MNPSHRFTPIAVSVLTLAGVVAAPRVARGQSSIPFNFNGTPIPPGSDIWFNSVFKVSGLGTVGGTIRFVASTIQFVSGGHTYTVAVPNATITFSAAVTTASTTFDGVSDSWITRVPLGFSDNVFLAGAVLPLAAGLPGGIAPVIWSGTFLTSAPGVTLQWQWGAAAYSTFSTNLAALGVKPLHSTSLDAYHTGDQAGTPEAFTCSGCVIGGATGGGGSNWSGSLSGTESVTPAVTPEPSTVVLLATGLLAVFAVGFHRARV